MIPTRTVEIEPKPSAPTASHTYYKVHCYSDGKRNHSELFLSKTSATAYAELWLNQRSEGSNYD